MVATTGTALMFTATKLGIFPEPDAANPIEGKLFVQLYTILPPTVGLLKVTAVELAPLHNIWLATGLIVAVGLTRTVAVIAGPAQPLAVGVMVKVTVTGALVVLVNEPLILPAPLAAMPVTATALSLTQL